MTICIYQGIAELRAELAHCLLTKHERAAHTKRLAQLIAEAEHKEKAAWEKEA